MTCVGPGHNYRRDRSAPPDRQWTCHAVTDGVVCGDVSPIQPGVRDPEPARMPVPDTVLYHARLQRLRGELADLREAAG